MISNAPMYIVDSDRPVHDIQKDFSRVASRHKYGVLAVYDLRQKMHEKGVLFPHDCLVFSVCNPRQAKQVLDANMGISTLLPCRISVYRENSRTKIATMRPTVLLSALGHTQLEVAEEVERNLLQIMEELAAPKQGRSVGRYSSRAHTAAVGSLR